MSDIERTTIEDTYVIWKMILIRNKHGYSDEFTNILEKIAEAMITYYGPERKETIMNAIYNTHIHFQKPGEDPEEYFDNYFSLPQGINAEKDDFWAYHFSVGIPKGHKIKEESLIYVTGQCSELDLNSNDEQLGINLQCLIHEIIHCVKSHEGFKYSGCNFLIEKASGLERVIYDTNLYMPLENKYHALNEAMTTLQEWEIYELLTNKKANTSYSTYEYSANVLGHMLRNDQLRKVMIDAEFDKSEDWIEYIGTNEVERLEKNFEKWNNEGICNYDDLYEYYECFRDYSPDKQYFREDSQGSNDNSQGKELIKHSETNCE